MHLLYILLNEKKNKTYVGITSNLFRRIKEHNEGKLFYTSKFGPWKIIYVECFKERGAARLREKYFKSAAGRRKMKRILKYILE
jgi:putative endonuclease